MSVPLTHTRKALRQALTPYEDKDNIKALCLCFIDYLFFFTGQYGVVVLPLIVKPFASVIIFIAITRLFILGHDACHGSLTNSRWLNERLAQLLFLPSLTTFMGWTVGHNMRHHGFANLVTKDTVWRPLSPSAYRQLGAFDRLCYRIYRNHWGVGLYYFFELWWKYIYFPSTKIVGVDAGKRIHSDSLLVTVFLLVWLAMLFLLSTVTDQSYFLLLLLGFIAPFIAWNMMMSFVIYLHHTHPTVRWYQDETSWANSQPHISATVHIRFPKWLGMALHNIMEHPAHHLSMGIPCYNLISAQRRLEEILQGNVVIQDFSWKWFQECARVCKLYDFERQEWASFND
jgi:omega-6 fatty acid desaturase (delta-12 desaturase)